MTLRFPRLHEVRATALAVATGAALVATPDDAAAQRNLLSQHASLGQSVGYTDIAVEYNRPVARGRELFGSLVPWDQVWNPGADRATTVSFSTEVTVAGEPLPAGIYSLWMIPGRDRWTVIFSREAEAFHRPYPGEERDALRVTVEPREGAHREVLTFTIPDVTRASATLVFQWGTTVVPIPIVVPDDSGP